MRFSKLILVFIGVVCLLNTINAQTTPKKYDPLWKRVDSLITLKGLNKTAVTEVEKIYQLAKKEKEQAMLIKALLYKINLENTTQENAEKAGLESLEKEAAEATGTAKYILYSLLAQKYRNYFENHRWQLYGRTNTAGFNKKDVATWTATDFHKKISALYLASLDDETLLQQTPLKIYDPLIVKGNVRHLRPTLFDLLANRALDYFKNDERDINKPAYAFTIHEAAAFDPAADFVHFKFTTQDSTSLHHKALLIYQRLLAFHLKDIRPDALIDADLQRLQFVHQYAVMGNKDSLYYFAVNHVANQYMYLPAAHQAWYLLANWHADKARTYDAATDTANRYQYIRAKEICEQLLKQKDSSEGKINAFNLLQHILHREIQLNTEKVNIPDQPFRSLVSYRNVERLYLRLVKLNDGDRDKFSNRYDESYWQSLVQLPVLKTWMQALPATGDHQQHRTEIKIDALPAGEYLLLSSADAGFSLKKNPLAVQYFFVSNISFINSGNEYFVLHRESGKAFSRAMVNVWKQDYDYTQRKYTHIKTQSLRTDANGYFMLPDTKNNNNRNVRLEIIHDKDRLFLDNFHYIYYRGETNDKAGKEDYEEDNARIFFFTDRSIYRPGQTVYFKGIAVTKDHETKQSKIIPDKKSRVFLYDANDDAVDSVELTTNEYGSYTGKFSLPTNRLNGEFRIEDEDIEGQIAFSVEEYKRPRFYVDYEKIKTTYRVNDSITVTGTAKAFAGNNIDGAKVSYRVVREPRFIYPWMFWRRGYPTTSSMEITHGTLVTDSDGKFTVRFKAIPDLSIQRSLEPVFDYKIIADVTDINGETRSGESTVSVAYKPLQLDLYTWHGNSMPADSFRALHILTKNMNGDFVAAPVSVKIFRLQTPDRLIRSRYWSQPDQFVMSREEYLKHFPFDEYDNDSKKETWNRLEQVIDKKDSSTSTGRYLLEIKKFKPGWYAIEATATDNSGDSVKNLLYVLLYDEKQQETTPHYFTTTLTKTQIEPGEKTALDISTSADDVRIIQQIKRAENNKSADSNSTYDFISLDKENKRFEYKAEEKDRGGFAVTYFFVKHNRFHSKTSYVVVPWSNKELTISYETWRDNTLPGSEEEWKVKITGYRKEKVAAEMLASMYDASLDEFKTHHWYTPQVWPMGSFYNSWQGHENFLFIQTQEMYQQPELLSLEKSYDQLHEYNRYYFNDLFYRRSKQADRAIAGAAPGVALEEVAVAGYGTAKKQSLTGSVATVQMNGRNSAGSGNQPLNVVDGQIVAADNMPEAKDIVSIEVLKDEAATALYGAQGANGVVIITTKNGSKNAQAPEIKTRTNFNETAFFFPQLSTDDSGNISFRFTMPEALTRWKFQALAHTKDLSFGYTSKDIVTRKQLMVQPNVPRFLREGDRMELSTKVVNMTNREITGTVHLELLNAATMQPVDGWFNNLRPDQYFTVPAGGSVAALFPVQIPYQYNGALAYRFIAKANADSAGTVISDGEEAALAVLTNSMLVTESIPLPVRGNKTKDFNFEKLMESGSSETLQHHKLTVEFTSNPSWYAVQALPYLMEYPYDCAEQTFNRFYANALASKIANASPRIKSVFEKWKTTDTAALISNLQKNQELKSVLLEETPWVLEAKTESQQKKNIALLFDMVRMEKELASSLDKLIQLQSSNGGFVWFKGGPDDRYITQYILTGIGHLQKLQALPSSAKEKINAIVKAALPYLDRRIKEDYDALLKTKADLKNNHLGYMQVHYLYMRSFFPEYAIPGASLNAITYYRKQSKQYWTLQSRYMQGMIALQLFRTGDKYTALSILTSLKDNAVVSDEMGMYWKDNRSGYYWYQAPVETQSLLIEAFSEISKDPKVTGDLKTWLLKQKQTQSWQTTKATADACYALLLQGSDWLKADPAVTIKLGEKTVSSPSEPGTGYFKTIIEGRNIKPDMGKISVKVSSGDTLSALPTWGAVYWQYFERLDKVTPSATPLKLDKKLFIEKNSDNGPVLQPLNEGDLIKVGDKIKVRIEIRVDRDMEYVHMKDMRASCFEPVNVLSGYKWQGGLGYYETTKDASTSFFFDRLRKGTYVFEYALFASAKGNFSNGVTSIQCMYAPEFGSYSEGIRINVE